MSRFSFALAPSMVLAAGGFATAAVAGPVFTDTYGDGLTASDNQDVAIGTDLLGSPYGVAQYHYGLKPTGDISVAALSTIGPDSYLATTPGDPFTGTIFTTSDLPSASENFSDGYPKYNIPAAALVDGTVITADDVYAHLRFNIDGTTYLGSAHFDTSDHTIDGAKLMDVRYTAASVPEPAIWAEMIGGLGAIGGAMRGARRRKGQLATA